APPSRTRARPGNAGSRPWPARLAGAPGRTSRWGRTARGPRRGRRPDRASRRRARCRAPTLSRVRVAAASGHLPAAEGCELAGDAPGVEVARPPDIGVLACRGERVEPGTLLGPDAAPLGLELAYDHPRAHDDQIREAGLAASRVVGVVAQQAECAAQLAEVGHLPGLAPGGGEWVCGGGRHDGLSIRAG